MDLEAIIGLEIHVEMKTKSKMFSTAPVTFGEDPNTQTVPLDFAFPGTMPVVNKQAVINAINDILKDNDAIYLPSAPTVAPTFTNNNVDKMSDEYLIADNYMAIGNFGGLPSITIPLGFKDDLPFGGNLTGKAFDEDTLLSIANNLEKITGLSNLIARGK